MLKAKKNTLKIQICALLLLICLMLGACARQAPLNNALNKEDFIINTNCFVPPEAFFSLLPPKVEMADYPPNINSWKAVVAPHHALVGNLAAQAIAQLQRDPPKIVFLIGPNHSNSGAPALTTQGIWQTAGGRVMPETDAIEALLKTGLVEVWDEFFLSEHSMGALMPYIAYYLPEAKIVPLVLHYKYPPEKIKRLINAIKPWLDNEGAIIASIDFSHNLNMTQAEAKDAETARFLANYDSRTIAQLDSTYLDSPTIMASLLEYMLELGRSSYTCLANTNSGRVMRDSQMEVTSYFTLLY